MNGRYALNVSKLPSGVLDHRAVLWWGNTLLLVIETTVFGLLAATYFYVRMNTHPWPPPRWYPLPVIHNPLPDLMTGTSTLILLIISCLPMIFVDLSARRRRQSNVKIGLFISLAFCFILILVRFFEFRAMMFKWDANAYASIIWTILGMHLLHLLVGTTEIALILSWTFTRPLDDKHRLDTTVTAVYWYWIAAIWIPFYLIIYWGPRIL
jgi:cytochrome c oxidase subunit 3